MGESEVFALVTGAVVRLLRQRRGFTPEYLGRRAGMRPSTIRRLERGLYEASLFDLHQLAAALGLEGDLSAFIRDAWARSERAALAALDGKGRWWEAGHRVGGMAGVRGLISFAAAAAVG